jgi:hypothetical protein
MVSSCSTSTGVISTGVVKSEKEPPPERSTESEMTEESGETEAVPEGDGTEGPEAPSPPEETPEETAVNPLTPWTIYRFVFRHAGDGWSPVHRNGVPLLLFYDIDANGYNDVFALFIDREDVDDAEFAVLSDFSRLYDPDIEPFAVEVRLLFQRDGALYPGYTAELGKKLVIDDMSQFFISKTVKTPFALSINFQNPEGTERTWLFCEKDTFEQLTLRETFAAFIDIQDINTDGYNDILHFEKSFEEGMGYETYITWYNWNGRTYFQNKVTNIVRNLRDFLETTRDLISNEKWEGLITYGLPQRQLRLLSKRNVAESDIIRSLFIPTALEKGSEHPEIIDLNIETSIFPEILENPFQQNENGDFVFPLRVRVIAENGEYLYISRIGMSKNPFQSQQFYFILMNENVYN